MSKTAIGPTSETSIADLVSLRGKTAIVTGAAQGLGLAVAKRLAEAGASVFIGDFNAEGAQRAAREIEVSGGKAIGGALDVGDAAAVERVVAEVCERLGPIDILVNNAGIFPPLAIADLDDPAWHRVMRVNLDGALHCSRAVASIMADRSRGVIVNITSTASVRAQTSGMAAYIVSKHGLDGLTKAMAVEYGPKGIRVVSVAPTAIPTPGLLALASGAAVTETTSKIHESIPMRRLGTEDEVARVVLFCACDLGAFVSGTTVFVDGGSTAG